MHSCTLAAAAARKRGRAAGREGGEAGRRKGGEERRRSSWETEGRRGEERRRGQQWRWLLLLDRMKERSECVVLK